MAKKKGTIEGRVAKGVAFMDKRDLSWRSTINRELLYQGSSENCVLGQRYGHYTKGLSVLGLSRRGAVRLGFLVPTEMFDEPPAREYYIKLTDEWKKYIPEQAAA